jgi:hypothetical protein
MEQDSEFKTTDLYFAAYLQTAGVQMLRSDKRDKRLSFVFDATTSNIHELTNAWVNRSGKVSAISYADAIKGLKHLCHM